ncbi:uncharacterized protein LOC111917354 [Lactuca sativa]|uniref:uncharacterized protein LOC111917354 n=1 Tax=Lactuca sativa TaxID=4236 RepID=UPI000CD94F07|nr:uncharacterized protein LOC111917354 [Lactuca sativa]
MDYMDVLSIVTKFKKSCLPPQWDSIFTLLVKGLSERVAGSDGASNGFMTILYGLYHGINLDYGTLIWAQVVQSLNSSSSDFEISYGRFWTFITQRTNDHYKIPIMTDALLSSVATFHTKKIIVTDSNKYSFNDSIPESMYRCVTNQSHVMADYRKLSPIGPRELTLEMKTALDVVENPTKRGKKPTTKKAETKGPSNKAATPKKRKADKEAPSAPKTKKFKKMVKKPKDPSPSNSEHNEEPPVEEEEEVQDEATSTTTTTTEPPVRVNVSDTGAPTIETETTVTTKPLSPSPSLDSTPILGGDNFEYDSTYYSPYPLPSEDDNDAPVTTQQLKDLNAKLDKLIASSATYFNVVMKAFLDTSLQRYTESIDKSTKAVNASTSSCKKATIEVADLIRDSKIFLESFKGHADSNAAKVNTTVDSLSNSLQEEKAKFDTGRSEIKDDHSSHITSVNAQLDKLHADLAMENKIMDELARKSTTIEVQNVQLAQPKKEIDTLKTERAVLRSCTGDVLPLLGNLVNAHDPILTLKIRNHLTTKLLPAIEMLSQMKGVTEPIVTPQQGGESFKTTTVPPKVTIKTEPKVNEASGSGVQNKPKGTSDDSDDEEETIAEALKRKKRDKEIDENLRIAREEEERESANKKKNMML